MTNIDRFNECTARLFAALYESFPVQVGVVYAALLDKEAIETSDDDLTFALATLHWLDDAGYIKVKIYGNDEAYNVVLTAKGLETLKAVPDSIKNKGSIGDALVSAMKSGTNELAKQLAAKVFTEGFKLMGM